MSFITRKSITFRLTILFATVSTTVILLLVFVVAELVERHFEELDQNLLNGKLELVRQALAEVNSTDDFKHLPGRLNASLVGHHSLSLAVLDANGRSIYAATEVEFPESLKRTTMPDDHRLVRWVDRNGLPYRGVSGSASTGIPGSGAFVISVATDLAHHEHFMRSFQTALWSFVALAAMLSGLLGWIAARKGLAPLREMCRDAAGITATRLNQRLAADAIPIELAEVARTLNEMLARLEESFHRLSDFSSDLAHELRTPVTNLLTQTQVTLSKARTTAEYQEVLASNSEELERMTKMISDMLFLAKADNNLVVPNLEPVDLRKEVDSLLEFYDAVAEDGGVQLSVTGQATVSGDRLMLRRAVGNLLSNAIQHTPRGGQVRVTLSSDSLHSTVISVDNTGETIPPEHLSRLFDRFYRVDPARQRLSDGVGLGLAITRSIVGAHGGDALVHSANGVTTFVLKLPN